MKFKLEMYNELDTRRDPRGHLHENLPFAKTRPLALGRTMCMCNIYYTQRIHYNMRTTRARQRGFTHGGIVKILLKNFLFLKKKLNTIILLLYNNTRTRVIRLADVQKLILKNNTHQ